ncbi:hypothetical protein STEG23_017368 [Scotinomys teguina]
MQPDRTTNNGGGTMEVVAAAPRCQLLLIVLMAAMLLPGMKVSPLLVRRKITRTTELQESIGKGQMQSPVNLRTQGPSLKSSCDLPSLSSYSITTPTLLAEFPS